MKFKLVIFSSLLLLTLLSSPPVLALCCCFVHCEEGSECYFQSSCLLGYQKICDTSLCQTTTTTTTTTSTTTTTTTICASRETNCANGRDDDCDGEIDCKDPDCAGKDTNNDGLIDCCQKKEDCGESVCFRKGKTWPSECGVCTDECLLTPTECRDNKCYYGSVACSCYAYEYSCTDGEDNDRDLLIDCEDPDCCGRTGPNGVICCDKDACCTEMDCDLYRAECKNYRCECPEKCETSAECIEEACCKYEITKKKEDMVCVKANTIVNYGSVSYLCDPPLESSKERSLLDTLLNYLFSIFS